MRMSLKNILPGLFCTAVILGLAVAAKNHWMFSTTLTAGVELHQKPFTHVYYLETPKGVVIENVHGWIIRGGYIYGSYGKIAYFMIDLKSFQVSKFEAMFQMSDILELNGLPMYNMSEEENLSHVRWGGERKYISKD